MTIFFTSDSHHLHANILFLGDGRPFKNIAHHDTMLRANWFNTVGEEDMVVHHGDVAMGPWPKGLESLEGLPGYKVLIPGNHDRVSSLESVTRRERFTEDYLRVFDEIWDETVTMKIQGVDFVLSHYPYNGDHTPTDRHTKLRPVDEGVPLLHGHTHQTEKVTRSSKGTLMLSVGVDANDFAPVSEHEILKRLEEASKA